MKEHEIRDLFGKHGVSISRDDVWAVQGTPVIKHSALERLAAHLEIRFELPIVLRSERDEAVMIVKGVRKDGISDWSTGEALIVKEGQPGGNYKVSGKQAGYVYAMSEKRARDRVIIKLAGLHGAYSEDEADDFKQKQQNATTEARRLSAPQEAQEQSGEPIPYSNEESPPTAPVEPPEMHEAPPPSAPEPQQEHEQPSRPVDNRSPTEKAEAIKQTLLACKSPAEIAKLMGHKAVIATLEDLDEELVEEIRVIGRKRNADLKATAFAERKAASAANTNQQSAKAANANSADQAEQAV